MPRSNDGNVSLEQDIPDKETFFFVVARWTSFISALVRDAIFTEDKGCLWVAYAFH